MGWGDESSSRPSCFHVALRSRTLILMTMECANRWERTGFDTSYGKLSDQLQTVSAEVDAVASGINMAQIAERHAAAESEALRAQGDSEQVVCRVLRLTPCALHVTQHAGLCAPSTTHLMAYSRAVPCIVAGRYSSIANCGGILKHV